MSQADRIIADAAVARPAPPAPSAPRRSPVSLPLALLAAGSMVAAASVLPDHGGARLALHLTAAVLYATALVQAVAQALRRLRDGLGRRALTRFLEGDATVALLVGPSGAILWRNAAASERLADIAGETLTAVLAAHLASPGPLIDRLGREAAGRGVAREDLVTRRGHVRLTVHPAGADRSLWQIEEVGERGGTGRAADALGLPLMTAGPSGTILYVNDAARKLFGGRPRQLDAVLPSPLAPGRVQPVEGADGPVDCLVAVVSGGGGRREVYLLPADSARREGASGAWDGLEDLPIPLLKLSIRGEVLAANREARDLLPMAIGSGSRLSDLLEGMGRPLADWVADVAEGRPTAGPQVLRCTGEHRDTHLRLALELAGPPGDLYILAVLDDVTEFKTLEAQFVQSQKMQAIGQLAGGVAHDFNNLLTAISGHCDLLLMRHGPTDPDYADLIQVHQNANRAAALVAQLLAFSRKQAQVVETLDLRDVLSDLTHLLNRLVGAKVRLTFDHDPDLRFVRADKRQLEQVVINLAVNARDAMPDGGLIRVETENRRLDRAWRQDSATVAAGDWVVIRIRDEGHGIPPERLPKIFEPFYTTKRQGEGTGLGLSTVYGIVKQSGGFVFADSEVGTGTTFTIWLPACDREATGHSPAAAPPAPVAHRGGEVVLLVEDEAPVRAFAARALRLRGYTVFEADSAEAALDIVADRETRIDLFLTDVIMPGKDGPTWVREAIGERPGTRVIFVSGYAEESFGEHKALIPGARFLPKPFSLTELTEAVDLALQDQP